MSEWHDVQERAELELVQLRQLLENHRTLVNAVAEREPNPIEISALSAYLHAFYTGVENIFKQIALHIDDHRPSSEKWHAELLARMGSSTDKRPAVISTDLQDRLVAYLGFRHVFRHAYTFEIEWEKMRDLVLASEATLDTLAAALRGFFARAKQ